MQQDHPLTYCNRPSSERPYNGAPPFTYTDTWRNPYVAGGNNQGSQHLHSTAGMLRFSPRDEASCLNLGQMRERMQDAVRAENAQRSSQRDYHQDGEYDWSTSANASVETPPMKSTLLATPRYAASSEVADSLIPAFMILYYDYRMEFMAAFSTFWKKHWGDFCGIDTVDLMSEQLIGLGPLHTPLDPSNDDTYNTVDNQTAIHIIQVFSQIYLLHADELLSVIQSEWPRAHPRSNSQPVAHQFGSMHENEDGSHGQAYERSEASLYFPDMQAYCRANELSFQEGEWSQEDSTRIKIQTNYLMLIDAIFPDFLSIINLRIPPRVGAEQTSRPLGPDRFIVPGYHLSSTISDVPIAHAAAARLALASHKKSRMMAEEKYKFMLKFSSIPLTCKAWNDAFRAVMTSITTPTTISENATAAAHSYADWLCSRTNSLMLCNSVGIPTPCLRFEELAHTEPWLASQCLIVHNNMSTTLENIPKCADELELEQPNYLYSEYRSTHSSATTANRHRTYNILAPNGLSRSSFLVLVLPPGQGPAIKRLFKNEHEAFFATMTGAFQHLVHAMHQTLMQSRRMRSHETVDTPSWQVVSEQHTPIVPLVAETTSDHSHGLLAAYEEHFIDAWSTRSAVRPMHHQLSYVLSDYRDGIDPPKTPSQDTEPSQCLNNSNEAIARFPCPCCGGENLIDQPSIFMLHSVTRQAVSRGMMPLIDFYETVGGVAVQGQAALTWLEEKEWLSTATSFLFWARPLDTDTQEERMQRRAIISRMPVNAKSPLSLHHTDLSWARVPSLVKELVRSYFPIQARFTRHTWSWATLGLTLPPELYHYRGLWKLCDHSRFPTSSLMQHGFDITVRGLPTLRLRESWPTPTSANIGGIMVYSNLTAHRLPRTITTPTIDITTESLPEPGDLDLPSRVKLLDIRRGITVLVTATTEMSRWSESTRSVRTIELSRSMEDQRWADQVMRRAPTITEHLCDRTDSKRYLHLKLDSCLYLCYFTDHRLAYTSLQTQIGRVDAASTDLTIHMESRDIRHPSNRAHATNTEIIPHSRINALRGGGSPRHTREPANPFSRICNYDIRPEVIFHEDLTRTSPSLDRFSSSGSEPGLWSWDVSAKRQPIYYTAEYNARFSHM